MRAEVFCESETRYLFTMYSEMPGPDGTLIEKKVMEMVGEKQ